MTLNVPSLGCGLLIVLQLSVGVIVCQNLRLGSAINLFERFGYLHISMRVLPRNETRWIFREPSVEIFKDIESVRKVERIDENKFKGNFEIALCNDLQELFKTYFQDFSVERLDEPWEAFLDNYTKESLAYILGINDTYVSRDYCYVLVRITRLREKVTFLPEFDPLNSTINENAAEKAETVVNGDTRSVWGFIKTFGSHYITSYSTGNSMYQVIVYSPKTFDKLKKKLLTVGKLESVSAPEMNAIFSPEYAAHMGTVLTSSGNASLFKWAESTLQSSYTDGQSKEVSYVNLLKLYRNSKLLKKLKILMGNEALLHLNLMTVDPLFKDENVKKWFLEILDNNLKLWEVN